METLGRVFLLKRLWIKSMVSTLSFINNLHRLVVGNVCKNLTLEGHLLFIKKDVLKIFRLITKD